MNILPDSLKLTYEPEPDPEPKIKEIISESGSVIEIVDKDTGESNPNFVYDDIPLEPLDKEPDLPTFVPKPQPTVSMFEEPTYKSEVKLTKKGRPRKPMSDSHKAKLAIAREKANAKKRYLKEQRDKAKAEAGDKKKEIKQSDVVPQIKVVAEPAPAPAPTPEPPKSIRQSNGITIEDLEKAQLNTILTIEKMRKDRKTEKKKKQLEEEYKQETIKTIKKINNWQQTAGQYANCF